MSEKLSITDSDPLFDVLEGMLQARKNVPDTMHAKAYISSEKDLYQVEVTVKIKKVELYLVAR